MSDSFDLGSIEQIPIGEGREFTVKGERIAVFRPRSGGVFATQAECPHRGGPLCEGLIGGLTVVCPYHSWKFDLASGNGLPTNPAGDGLKTYVIVQGTDGSIQLIRE